MKGKKIWVSHNKKKNVLLTKITDSTQRRIRDVVKQKNRREENTIDNNEYQFQKHNCIFLFFLYNQFAYNQKHTPPNISHPMDTLAKK